MTRRILFAPIARAFLEEARSAGNPHAGSALGELNRLEALVREVRRHEAGNTTRKTGVPPCRCGGPRECMLHIVNRASEIRPASSTARGPGTEETP